MSNRLYRILMCHVSMFDAHAEQPWEREQFWFQREKGMLLYVTFELLILIARNACGSLTATDIADTCVWVCVYTHSGNNKARFNSIEMEWYIGNLYGITPKLQWNTNTDTDILMLLNLFLFLQNKISTDIIQCYYRHLKIGLFLIYFILFYSITSQQSKQRY